MADTLLSLARDDGAEQRNGWLPMKGLGIIKLIVVQVPCLSHQRMYLLRDITIQQNSTKTHLPGPLGLWIKPLSNIPKSSGEARSTNRGQEHKARDSRSSHARRNEAMRLNALLVEKVVVLPWLCLGRESLSHIIGLS